MPASAGNLAAPIDPAINPDDSYVIAELEVKGHTELSLDAEVYDPVTRRITTKLTLDMGTTNLRVEAGYTTAGEPVVVEYDLDAPGDPTVHLFDEASGARGIGDSHVIFDQSYQPIATAPTSPDGSVEQSPLFGLGEHLGVIGDGMVLSEANLKALTAGEALRPGDAPVTVERSGDGSVRLVSNFAPGVPAHLAPGGPSTGTPGRGRLVRTYRPGRSRGGVAALVLAEVLTEVEDAHGQGRSRMRETVRLTNVDWRQNTARDEERRRQPRGASTGSRATPPTQGSQPALSSLGFNECEGMEGPEILPPHCSGDSGGGGGGSTPPPSSACTAAGTQNIVLQHGFKSSAERAWGSSWRTGSTRNLLERTFCLDAVVAPTLPNNGFGRHQNQTVFLKEQILATGKEHFVMIGHSQGGIISRRAAQQFVREGRANLVEGVVTIGTPHQGAYLALSSYSGVSNLTSSALTSLMACGGPLEAAVCAIIANAAVRYTLDGLLQVHLPAGIDNRPGSDALREIEQDRPQTEQAFQRYGIQHYPDKRWMLLRLAGDSGETLRGSQFVTGMTWAYRGLRLGGWISLFAGRPDIYHVTRVIMRVADDLDHFWDRLTAPGMTSDGIVQGPSQVYPGAQEQRTLRGRNAVSHVGETQSRKTLDEIDYLFTTRFSVLKR